MGIRIKVGMLFSRLRIPANVWTLLIVLPALATFYFLFNNQFLYAGISFLIAVLFDVVDGAVAEVTTKVTPKGAFLDETVTMYLEAFALLGLFSAQLPAVILPANAWAFLALLGFLGMEYSSKAAKARGLIERDRAHLVVKPTRIGLVLAVLFSAVYSKEFAVALLAVTAVIALIAMLNRQVKALAQ